MRVIDAGLGGLVVAWPSADLVPAEVVILKGGHQVDTVRVTRIPAAGVPIVNLVDPQSFVRRVTTATPCDALPEGAHLGAGLTAEWTVTGEATPFCFRPHDRGASALGWDLTEPLGLSDWRPAPAQAYTLLLDIGQHRCGAGLQIEWLDDPGAVMRRDEAWRDTGPYGGRDPSGYQTLTLATFCPDGGARARVTLLHGLAVRPPDAFLFFRNPRLVEGDPAGRPMMRTDATALPGDPACYGVVPVGDALRTFGRPIAIGDSATVIDVPQRGPLSPRLPLGLTMRLDGRDLVLEGAAPPDAVLADRAVAVVIDDALAATGTLRRGEDSYGARIALESGLFDGERHQVDVREEAMGETLATGIIPLDAQQTPPALFRSHVSRPETPGLLPFAAERYRALAATLARLASTDAPAWLYAEVAAAHVIAMRGPRGDNATLAPRRMPIHDAPHFSIVIPVHDKLAYTYFCLAAVLLTTAGLPVEVIVVDDGSTDRTAELETIWAGVRVVRRETAGGFVRACTAGAAAARGEFLIFLNNDTEPTGRWLEELHLPFLAFADVGMTGAKLVYPDGRLQEAGGIIWNNGRPWNLGWGGNPADPAFNYTRQADYLTGAAFMISRAAWDAAGGFSAEFEPAYYEDTDLAFKIRELGLRTVYAARSTVIHYEGVSSGAEAGQNPNGGMKRFQEINRPKFEAKWRHRFRALAAEGSSPNREKDRGVIARALVLDSQPPRVDMDAGSLAISQEIRLLQSLGYKVSIAPRNMAHLGLYTETFERGGVEHLHAPFYSSLADVIARRAAEFDLIYIHRFETATGLPALIRQHAPNARILLNCADVHFLRQLRAARLDRSEAAFEAALLTRDAELAIFDEVDTVLTYSDVEKAVIEAQGGIGAHVLVLPFVAGDVGDPVPLADRRDIGFIGSFDHPPNCDAVEWFVRECWPAIREGAPGVRLRIAGAGFDRFALAKDDDRIDLIGWVPDARAFAGSCRVMVAPLRVGAGVKGKVVDALAAGTPNVLSPVAAEGLGLDDGITATIARTPAAWAAATLRLLSDDAAWTAMSRASLDHLRARHSLASARVRFREILDQTGLPYDPSPDPGTGALAPLVSYDVLSRMI